MVNLTPNRSNILDYLNVATGLIEIVLVFGFSSSFYFIGTIMVENGHFCDPDLLENYQIDNQTLEFIKICSPNFQETQLSKMSLIVILGVTINGLLGYLQGFIVDRFGVLFVRILIHIFHISGFLSLAFMSFQTEYLTYVSILSFSFGNGVLITLAVRDFPLVMPRYKEEITSISVSIFIASGFVMMMFSKYLIGNPVRFEQVDYFWNLKNFSFLALVVSLGLGILRTALWQNQIGPNPKFGQFYENRSPREQDERSPSSIYKPDQPVNDENIPPKRGSSLLSTLPEDFNSRNSIIKRTSVILKRRSTQILDYKPPNQNNSLLTEIKTLKLWSHTFQLNFSNLPYYSFIGYINQYMIYKQLDKLQQNQVLMVGGYLLLTVAVMGYLYGLLVKYIDQKFKSKQAFIVLLILTNLFNVVAIIVAVLGPKTENLIFMYVSYFCIICTAVFNWANCYYGIGCLWPQEMHGQCYGFVNTIDGITGFLPVVIGRF